MHFYFEPTITKSTFLRMSTIYTCRKRMRQALNSKCPTYLPKFSIFSSLHYRSISVLPSISLQYASIQLYSFYLVHDEEKKPCVAYLRVIVSISASVSESMKKIKSDAKAIYHYGYSKIKSALKIKLCPINRTTLFCIHVIAESLKSTTEKCQMKQM